MGLLTDGQINDTQDLRNYENGILDVASLENIDLTGKMTLALDEISTSILNVLLKQSERDRSCSYVLAGGAGRRRLGVSDVTVTPQLKRWHALKTLTLAYADAYNNQLNDRYGNKWKQYDSMSLAAERTFFEIGVGLCSDPLGKAPTPVLGSIPGTGPPATFYVGIAWTNRAGQEGLSSEVVAFSTTPNTQLVVDSLEAPANATGFNVYVGPTPDGMSLQNDVPVPVGSRWILPSSGIRQGRRPGQGQSAERFVSNEQIFLRG